MKFLGFHIYRKDYKAQVGQGLLTIDHLTDLNTKLVSDVEEHKFALIQANLTLKTFGYPPVLTKSQKEAERKEVEQYAKDVTVILGKEREAKRLEEAKIAVQPQPDTSLERVGTDIPTVITSAAAGYVVGQIGAPSFGVASEPAPVPTPEPTVSTPEPTVSTPEPTVSTPVDISKTVETSSSSTFSDPISSFTDTSSSFTSDP